MSFQKILNTVNNYYSAKLATHGPTPHGVDWNSRESQEIRFAQLLRICNEMKPFTLNDYGCGYGALVDYLRECNIACQYRGFDISEAMITEARKLHTGVENCVFYTEIDQLPGATYTVASGIFNVQLESRKKEWEAYILDSLHTLARLSEEGFSFNVLTSYSDAEYMRPDLYYADPLVLFDYCKRHFSRYVALQHDYPLYEFTILVRRDKQWPNW